MATEGGPPAYSNIATSSPAAPQQQAVQYVNQPQQQQVHYVDQNGNPIQVQPQQQQQVQYVDQNGNPIQVVGQPQVIVMQQPAPQPVQPKWGHVSVQVCTNIHMYKTAIYALSALKWIYKGPLSDLQ